MTSQLCSITTLLGSHVSLTLGSAPTRTLSGKLWAYDPSLGMVALECQPTPLPPHLSSSPAASASIYQTEQTSRNRFSPPIPTTAFTLVKVCEIKQIVFPPSSSTSSNDTNHLTPIHPLSLKSAQQRESFAIKQSLTTLARTAKHVSTLAQQTFIALSKTLPCRWHNSHIVVLEEVVISPPNYDGASTNVPGYSQHELQAFVDGTNKLPPQKGVMAKANSWHQVVKVLQGERQKLFGLDTLE